MVKEIKYADFEKEVINCNVPVMIDFYATWCGPCMMLSPLVDKISENYNGKVKFLKVNVDEEEELAIQFKVSSIPLLVLIKDNKVVNQSLGYIDENKLNAFINSAL